MNDLKEQIKLLPDNPGIYKYFDKTGHIIYIGKAKNLKKRVSSYFTSNSSHSGRIKVMVSRIVKIEYTIVETESEALLLENSLIKKHQPKYNVKLKDGKTYPLIVVVNEDFPRIFSTRIIERDGSEYFGPFVSGLSKNYLLDLLRKTFKLRTCSYLLSPENIAKKKFKVCLNYHIDLCKGPCEGFQNLADYEKNIEKVKKILKGNTSKVIEYVKEEMKEAAENLEFERANELKQTLEALISYESRSTVVNPKINNVDVFALFSNEKYGIVNYLKVANGAIISTDTFEYRKQIDESDETILEYAIAEMRERYQSKSKELYVPFMPHYVHEDLKYSVPKIGDKKKLLDLSYKNAYYYYLDIEKKKSAQKDKNERQLDFLKKVQKDMGLKSIPYRIECFDNSNIQGSFPVAAMSVFENGKPHKKSYRHYNIKTVEGPDDFASMEEVIYRRYKRVLDEKDKLPNLIVIDGGKGQLNAAFKSILKLGIEKQVDIIGIAKKLEELYKIGDKYPLSIDKKSPTNKLIQQIRNEAHRFGITHHRNRRMKATVATELEDIKGIGKQTADKLLENFKSVKKIKESNFEELKNLLGQAKAQIVYNYFIDQKKMK